MTDTPDLVVLLYRADWTRLSLAAEVSHTIDRDLDAVRPEAGMSFTGAPTRRRGPDGPVAGFGRPARPSGNEWETATDLQGTESSRATGSPADATGTGAGKSSKKRAAWSR
jgi:hypothetical protein